MDFSSVFVYATGNAFTMPQSIYMLEGNIVKEYGKYNGARMPAYTGWIFRQIIGFLSKRTGKAV